MLSRIQKQNRIVVVGHYAGYFLYDFCEIGKDKDQGLAWLSTKFNSSTINQSQGIGIASFLHKINNATYEICDIRGVTEDKVKEFVNSALLVICCNLDEKKNNLSKISSR